MPPTSWVTAEQNEFCQGFYAQFMECQAKRSYSDFWPDFYSKWFDKYPEQQALFPEIPEDATLTKEQSEALGKAVETRKQQLLNRLQNKWGASWMARHADMDVKASAAFVADVMKSRDGRTRKPQKIEVYLSLYYDEKIKMAVEGAGDIQKDVAVAAVSMDNPKGEKLSPKLATIMKKARDMYKKESPEVKAQVDARWQELVDEKASGSGKGASFQPQYYIDRIAPTLGHFLQGLQELTGWSFSVLMGGPSPESGGKIEACSIHVGETTLGNTFDKAYPSFVTGVMQPYRSFLEKVPGGSQRVRASESKGEVDVSHGSASDTMAEKELISSESVASEVTHRVPQTGQETPKSSKQPPPLQLTEPNDHIEVAEIDQPFPPAASHVDNVTDAFSYDFGSQVPIDPLDNFLANYSRDPLQHPDYPVLPQTILDAVPSATTHFPGVPVQSTNPAGSPILPVYPGLPSQAVQVPVRLPEGVASALPPSPVQPIFPQPSNCTPYQIVSTNLTVPFPVQPVPPQPMALTNPSQTAATVSTSPFPVQPVPPQPMALTNPSQTAATVSTSPFPVQPVPPQPMALTNPSQTVATVSTSPFPVQPVPPQQMALTNPLQIAATVSTSPFPAQFVLPQPTLISPSQIAPTDSTVPLPFSGNYAPTPLGPTPSFDSTVPLVQHTISSVSVPGEPTPSMQVSSATPQSLPLPPHEQQRDSAIALASSTVVASQQLDASAPTIAGISEENNGKRKRQASTRNQLANSIGDDTASTKKRAGRGKSGNPSKKTKTK